MVNHGAERHVGGVAQRTPLCHKCVLPYPASHHFCLIPRHVILYPCPAGCTAIDQVNIVMREKFRMVIAKRPAACTVSRGYVCGGFCKISSLRASPELRSAVYCGCSPRHVILPVCRRVTAGLPRHSARAGVAYCKILLCLVIALGCVSRIIRRVSNCHEGKRCSSIARNI